MFRALKITDLACVSTGTTVAPISQTALSNGGVSGLVRVPTASGSCISIKTTIHRFPQIGMAFAQLPLLANEWSEMPRSRLEGSNELSQLANDCHMLDGRSQGKEEGQRETAYQLSQRLRGQMPR